MEVDDYIIFFWWPLCSKDVYSDSGTFCDNCCTEVCMNQKLHRQKLHTGETLSVFSTCPKFNTTGKSISVGQKEL